MEPREMINKMIKTKRDVVNNLIEAYIFQEMIGNKTTSLKEIAVNSGTAYWKVRLIYEMKTIKYAFKNLF